MFLPGKPPPGFICSNTRVPAATMRMSASAKTSIREEIMEQANLRPALLAGAFSLLCGIGPAAADAGYFDRFEGKWSGSGQIQRDVDSAPRKVSCSVSGARSSPNRISIAGTCRAAVIFTRKIGAELTYDPADDTFSGVYTGSTKGPARLSGRLKGDALVLTITYAKPVYGDRTALMTIGNAGSGAFSMVVTDKVEGATKETSSIRFSKG